MVCGLWFAVCGHWGKLAHVAAAIDPLVHAQNVTKFNGASWFAMLRMLQKFNGGSWFAHAYDGCCKGKQWD
jgi:hypothetical protein